MGIFEYYAIQSGDGEFDCPGAVWVNRIGQFIVSDRYNHRIQGKFQLVRGEMRLKWRKLNFPVTPLLSIPFVSFVIKTHRKWGKLIPRVILNFKLSPFPFHLFLSSSAESLNFKKFKE